MKNVIFIFGIIFLFLACGQRKASSDNGGSKMHQINKVIKDTIVPLIEKDIKKDTDDVQQKNKIGNQKLVRQEFYNQVNDYDSLGRPYVRWIEFRDTITGELLNKIDVIEEDNPYIQAGVKIDFVDENGPQVYYDLGSDADRNTVKPFLSEEEYKMIPTDLIYPKALSMVLFKKVDKNLIINYSFEWEGLEREWIRGEYIGHAVMVYNQKGELIYRNINTTGELSYISPSGDFLFFVENKNHDDWEKQIGCLSIYSKEKENHIFLDCTPKSTWNIARKMLDEFILLGNCKRQENFCFQSLLYNTNTNKFFLIQKKENEAFRVKNGPYKLYNKKNNSTRVIDLNKFEILTNPKR